MSAPGSSGRVQRLAPPPPLPRLLGPLVAVTAAAIVVSLLLYLYLVPSLPTRVPIHFASPGTPSGGVDRAWLPLILFLVEAGPALALLGSVGGIHRSGVLAERYPTLSRSLSAFAALVLGVGLPAANVVLLLTAASLLPAWSLPLVVVVVVLSTVAGIFSVLRSTRPAGRPGALVWRGEKRYRCSACGTEFRSRARLGVHFGIGGVPGAASTYLRCPQCGELEWQELVGRGSRAME